MTRQKGTSVRFYFRHKHVFCSYLMGEGSGCQRGGIYDISKTKISYRVREASQDHNYTRAQQSQNNLIHGRCQGCVTTRGCSGGDGSDDTRVYGVNRSGNVGKELPRVEPVNVCPLCGRTCPKHHRKHFQDACVRRYVRVNPCCTRCPPQHSPLFASRACDTV